MSQARGEESKDESSSVAPLKRDEMEKGLAAIYGAPDEQRDLATLEQGGAGRWLRLFVIGLCLLAGVVTAAWGGFFLLQPLRQEKVKGLELEIRGTEEGTIGREASYEIAWKNAGLRPLLGASVRLSVPTEFQIAELDPPPSRTDLQEWDLGLVPVGGSGVIRLRGTYSGALGAASSLQVLGSYRVSSLSQELETVATRAIAYGQSVVSGRLEVPPATLSGEALSVRYTVENQGEEPLNDLIGYFRLPDGFVRQTLVASPSALQEQEAFFQLGDLPAHASTTVLLNGLFTSGFSGETQFVARVGRRGTDDALLVVSQSEATTTVMAADLSVHLVANGRTRDVRLAPGEPLRLSLAYQNASPETLRDVTLLLGVESFVNDISTTGTSLVAWSALEDSAHGVSATQTQIQTLRYGQRQVAALASLAPQAADALELTLPTAALVSGTRTAFIRLTLQGAVASVGHSNVSRIARAEPLLVYFSSDADATIEARYFTEEGAPVGSGPIPPVVAKTTGYQIIWRAHKTLHVLDNVRLSAELPKNVAWGENASADQGAVSFDPATRRVTWTIGRLEEGTSETEARFNVQLTPGSLDVGRFASLLGETKFEASDVTDGQTIARNKPPLTSDLETDEGARGKGVVRGE